MSFKANGNPINIYFNEFASCGVTLSFSKQQLTVDIQSFRALA